MEYEPKKLTWTALMGRWAAFARSAVALPDDAGGRAWRACVPAMIGLQAVTAALGDVDELAPDERAVGMDRARLLIQRHADELHQHLGPAPLHPELEALIAEARAALEHAEQQARRGLDEQE